MPTFTHLGSCSSGCTSWHNDTQKFLKSESEVPRGQKLMHTFAGGCMLECLGYMLKKFPSFSVAKKLIQETCGVTVSTYFCSPSNLWDPTSQTVLTPKHQGESPSFLQKLGARTRTGSVAGGVGAGAGIWASTTTTTSCDWFHVERLKFPYSKLLERGFSEIWRYYETKLLKECSAFCIFLFVCSWTSSFLRKKEGHLKFAWSIAMRKPCFKNGTRFDTQESRV